jgi:hypothetical protein
LVFLAEQKYYCRNDYYKQKKVILTICVSLLKVIVVHVKNFIPKSPAASYSWLFL